MCGIFVAFSMSENSIIDIESCITSTKSVSHRGPDNFGYYANEDCFLGHTRLSILGLEGESNQPYRFEQFVMVYNGEIFNYLELRERLTELGYKFSTNSDTEVLIKAFHRWGERCFKLFNGMWSLVIYDELKKSLLVSRDRFGQKPLFYRIHMGKLYVASEIHQLVEFSECAIDYEMVCNFLKEGSYVSNNRTFFRNIYEFPKAHNAKIQVGKEIHTTRYWDYPSGKTLPTTNDTYKKFYELLTNSVSMRMRSDVPISLLLSGGLDSTLIAVLVRSLIDDAAKISAYTFSSNDKYDESKFAKIVGQRLGFNVTFRKISESPIEYETRLRKIVRNMGRGHSSPAIVSVDYLYELVSNNGLKVALDGQGADEFLAGYPNYHMEMIAQYVIEGRFNEAYFCLRDLFQKGALASILVWLRNKMPEYLKVIGRRIYGYERFFTSVYCENVKLEISPTKSKSRNDNRLNRYLIDQHDIGLENLLYYSDIVGMKNSVESRSPFLDHHVVEFAFRHDDKLKLHLGVNKNVLKQHAYYKDFEDVLNRKKIGFESRPSIELKKYMCKILSSSPILNFPIFNKNTLESLSSAMLSNEKYERLLFRLYQVHLWHDEYYCQPHK